MHIFIKTAALFLIVTISVSLLWENVWQKEYAGLEQVYKQEGKRNKKKEQQASASSQITITHTWAMPAILREISGIAYVSSGQFACVQDELGTIFIYNTKSNNIEQQIPFGEAGDYEGITLVDQTAYIVRSDGRLYEVNNLTGSHPQVRQYETFLTARQDVEGLCYDQKHNRLLLSIKGIDPYSQAYKGIYAFDLDTKKLLSQPVYKITLDDPMFENLPAKKGKQATEQPSDIESHPLTGEIYLTEAVHHQLLVMDASGKLKNIYSLDKTLFAKPEGITFSPTGELYVSNEGKKGNGNILQVNIADNVH